MAKQNLSKYDALDNYNSTSITSLEAYERTLCIVYEYLYKWFLAQSGFAALGARATRWNGSVTFTSPVGDVLFTVGAPIMYDAKGKASADNLTK